MSGTAEEYSADFRLAQVRAIRELLAGRSDDEMIRVGDVHKALSNPTHEFAVDLMTPGPRELLDLVRRAIKQRVAGELTSAQTLMTIQGLTQISVPAPAQTPPTDGDQVT
ncbi:hypothetical protein GPZ77_34800 (plasmid) [Streptomyces sp. QHH-9511]|uniref:hypothetical protein n=1 Tax=Streptomyces sp. QHH-9511 TaxID=2684468 RepID=UPI001317E14B|nr:hypothetical protein [Streptomyces sp. QHH-9511]QGZ53398.1 hypothetical protein GPZ77_34800 [Streptomyces sp. QHH-9511]